MPSWVSSELQAGGQRRAGGVDAAAKAGVRSRGMRGGGFRSRGVHGKLVGVLFGCVMCLLQVQARGHSWLGGCLPRERE